MYSKIIIEKKCIYNINIWWEILFVSNSCFEYNHYLSLNLNLKHVLKYYDLLDYLLNDEVSFNN